MVRRRVWIRGRRRGSGKLTKASVFTLLVLLTVAAATRCSSTPPRADFPTYSPRAVALGKELFFEPKLSGNGTISCASCHQPARAFTNGLPFGVGIGGAVGDRNVPSLISRHGTHLQFWDGRAHSLEEQIPMVLTTANEMGATSMAQVAEKLNADPVYAAKFQGAFGRPATPDNVARALAAYIDSLAPGQAPYDRFLAGDETALTAAQQRGRRLFFNRFHCDACHSGPGFTDERLRPRCYPATNNLSDFRPIAVPPDKMVKTPTLRNLIYTAPYMHTGGLPTLEDVVDFYTPSFEVDTDGEPDLKKPIVHITDAERRDLVEFLKSLSASRPYEERVRE